MAPFREWPMHVAVAALLGSSICAWPQTVVNGPKSLVLAGKAAQVVVDLAGGSIADFHLRDEGLNPLRWEEPGGQTAPRPMGHFLCLDRWGPASEAEAKNGMPFHGEASRVEWQVTRDAFTEAGWVCARMSATLPLAGLQVKRNVRLSQDQPFFVVTEEVSNLNKLGRLFNMVQHATIGRPFLDAETLVDSNARKGFMQSSPLPRPEEPAVFWPQALKDGVPVDMRRLTDDPDPNVVSYVVDSEYGWATATSPSHGLLIGYLWRSSDYPWFNAWRDVEGGTPFARGLEFGTTGLHQPFPVLVAKGRIFDRPIYSYLDAGQTVTKSYLGFLFKAPADFRGVAALDWKDGKLTLRERGSERTLVMSVGSDAF